jgi:inner membrane protein
MDNFTHSLLGATLAHAFLPREATTGRGAFLAIGVVAANLPDIDVAYTWITPEPLGMLLHHRGHTHTLGGLFVLGVALAGIALLVPAIRALDAPLRRRLAVLGAVALSSHLVADSWNSYGTHPLWPFGSGWMYGDAVFIFEPWLWMLWGVPAATYAVRRWSRGLLIVALAAFPLLLAILGVVPLTAVGAIAVAGGAFAWVCGRVPPRTGAIAALGLSAAFVLVLFALRAEARGQAEELLAPEVRGDLVDVALSPEPADPRCWSVIAIERDEGRRQFTLHRGTLSLAPASIAPQDCALHRFMGLESIPWSGQSRLARIEPLRESLDRLRHFARHDCRVAAWMQFGRAPFFTRDGIADLRYDRHSSDNFSAMPILEGGACPAHVTSWGFPREDLLLEP